MGYTTDDALPYTAGVDRSPTEVAALFLEDHPDGDPHAFLVEALELDGQAAADALRLIVTDGAVATPEPGEDDDREQLLARAAELGVKVRKNASIETLLQAVADAERAALEARARELIPADELEALDIVTDDDLRAAIASAEAAQSAPADDDAPDADED